MKKLLLLISCIILHVCSYTQTDVQRDNRVSPVLKQALSSKSGYSIYGRANSSMFINIAVLNLSSHTMSWFTCHGRLFDSTKLTGGEYEQVISKQLDPFALYQHICGEYLTDIAVAKDIFRLNGDNKLVDSLNPTYHALFASESVQKAKTPLQKLIAIDNVRKHILIQLAYLNCSDPFRLENTPLFKINKEQAGTMIQTKDSTVYYNIDPTSAVAKISLNKNSPEKLYIYNRLSQLIDSVPVLREKYGLLLKEKTDVFLLYRGWLEMQWQGIMSTIMRYTKGIDKNDAGLYSQANIKDEKSTEKELYSELNAIEAKINVLVSPEAKSIEQAVYNTYKNETSEITYMPLLGIGYDLIEKRGQKEYELTNHLGNVLATVSDKKIGHSSNDSTVDYYNADVVSAQDYYPFGMLQPGRVLNVEKYRYGFNGKENDNEVKGDGNQQDYGMRIYDPRLGRFLSTDPLSKSYPMLTPYQFASNRPIDGIDLDGKEWSKTETYDPETGITHIHFQVKLKIENSSEVLTKAQIIGIGDAATKAFKEAYNVFDEKRKIQYSGDLQYEAIDGLLTDNDYGVIITDDNQGTNKVKIVGITGEINTQKNSFTTNGTTAKTGVLAPIELSEVARTIVHEMSHTANIWFHPFDPENNFKDVDLTPFYFQFDPKRSNLSYSNEKQEGYTFLTYKPSIGASLKEISVNIMMYNNVKVNGKPYPSSQLNKISPDQANAASKQVDKDKAVTQ